MQLTITKNHLVNQKVRTCQPADQYKNLIIDKLKY